MATPAAAQFEAVLSAKFPGIRFGRVNCRLISGSELWSQHSWNNARDIYPPSSIPYLVSNDGEYRAYLDEVHTFILENHEDLNVRVHLWQVESHYNHIHADFWPRGWATPPCAGGTSRYKYPNGEIEASPTLINTYYPPQEDDMPRVQWEQMIDALFEGPDFVGDPNYWKQLDPESPDWADFWAAFVQTISGSN